MTDNGGAAAPSREDGGEAAAGSSPSKTLPPLSKVISDASATGTSLTYTDYSLIPVDDDAKRDGHDDEHGGSGNNQGENFPHKLHRILSRPDLSHVISWLDHGRAWKVHRQDVFATIVIPEYYNHNKYTSFSRQVNGWGFRRIGSGKDNTAYYHELFLRGAPHLVRHMKRPGPVPSKTKKEDGCAADKKSKMGRRRRTPTDRANKPDFLALDKARPLPRENPPGFVYVANDAVAAAGCSSGSGLIVKQQRRAKPAAKPKKKRVASTQENDDIMKDAIDEIAKLKNVDDVDNKLENGPVLSSSSDNKSKKTRKSATKVAGCMAREIGRIGANGMPHVGGGNDGVLGSGMAALLDQQVKLVEMQKRVIAQVHGQRKINAQGVCMNPGTDLGDTTGKNLQQGQLDKMQNHTAKNAKCMVGMELLGSMAFEPDPLRCDVDGMDVSTSPALGPKDAAPFQDSAFPLDDFDKELDELAGFLGPVDAMDEDQKTTDPLNAWNQVTSDAAASVRDHFKLPPQTAEPVPIAPFPAGSGVTKIREHTVPTEQVHAVGQRTQMCNAHNGIGDGTAGGVQHRQNQHLSSVASFHNPIDPRHRHQIMMMMAQQHQQNGMGYMDT